MNTIVPQYLFYVLYIFFAYSQIVVPFSIIMTRNQSIFGCLSFSVVFALLQRPRRRDYDDDDYGEGPLKSAAKHWTQLKQNHLLDILILAKQINLRVEDKLDGKMELKLLIRWTGGWWEKVPINEEGRFLTVSETGI